MEAKGLLIRQPFADSIVGGRMLGLDAKLLARFVAEFRERFRS